MGQDATNNRIAAVRRFNRFYTRRLGVLRDRVLGSSLSLAEVRVLYELAHGGESSPGQLAATLGVDAGYLSRLLRKLDSQGFIDRSRGKEDGRRISVRLSRAGRETFAPLEQRSGEQIADLLAPLADTQQAALCRAMRTIERLLDPDGGGRPAIILREHGPGDLGWVVARHGAVYAQEYGWNAQFEALAAEVAATFLRNFDPAGERAWIADCDGEPVGSVVVVRENEATARLRLLLVEPHARGLGIGRALVDAAIRFARERRYRDLVLWTNDVLAAARRIYEDYGFVLVRSEPHRMFGPPMVGQTWNLRLAEGSARDPGNS